MSPVGKVAKVGETEDPEGGAEIPQCGREVDHSKVEVLAHEENEEVGEEVTSDTGSKEAEAIRETHRRDLKEGDVEVDRSRRTESWVSTLKERWVKKRNRRLLLPLHPLHLHHRVKSH